MEKNYIIFCAEEDKLFHMQKGKISSSDIHDI